ncbi:hypothetical protein BC937DRAFT_94681, partial [Endogone sp. FLAS-F59071]
ALEHKNITIAISTSDLTTPKYPASRQFNTHISKLPDNTHISKLPDNTHISKLPDLPLTSKLPADTQPSATQTLIPTFSNPVHTPKFLRRKAPLPKSPFPKCPGLLTPKFSASKPSASQSISTFSDLIYSAPKPTIAKPSARLFDPFKQRMSNAERHWSYICSGLPKPTRVCQDPEAAASVTTKVTIPAATAPIIADPIPTTAVTTTPKATSSTATTLAATTTIVPKTTPMAATLITSTLSATAASATTTAAMPTATTTAAIPITLTPSTTATITTTTATATAATAAATAVAITSSSATTTTAAITATAATAAIPITPMTPIAIAPATIVPTVAVISANIALTTSSTDIPTDALATTSPCGHSTRSLSRRNKKLHPTTPVTAVLTAVVPPAMAATISTTCRVQPLPAQPKKLHSKYLATAAPSAPVSLATITSAFASTTGSCSRSRSASVSSSSSTSSSPPRLLINCMIIDNYD